MRKRYLSLSGLVLLLITVCCTTTEDRKVVHIITSPGESAIIEMPGLKNSLKIMQITDSHISIADESEADQMPYGDRMHKAYLNPRKHYLLDTIETTFEYLDDVLKKAKEENVQLLLLTGDIVNFPSAVSANYVYDRLMNTGIPWLYISGNHDWHYEGMEGSIDSLRNTWIEKSLMPLYGKHNPLFYSEIINGINFVGIDNSTGEVNSAQVKFFEDQLALPQPVVILSHIPYNFDGETDRPGMDDFVDLVSMNCDKVVAIFTGHYHRSIYYFKGNLCQYITPATFRGSSFIVDILPVEISQP